MQISAENQEREITIFTNGQIPEVQVTTRREEAKENVNENLAPVIVVSENMEAVKGAAKYAQTFDDVLLNLPSIIKAIPAAETAVQAKDDAIAAKESAQESAETAQSAAVRAEETLGKMSRVMEYKGNVATFADLPTTAKIGDVWNVLDTGANYAWDGTTWDKFGELVDLSGYYTKEEAQTALAEKQDILEPGKGVKIEGNVISVEGGDGNAYTKENLIGGKGVEIVPEATGGGKDEHTLALWHFDENATDVIKGVSLTYNTQINQNGKFGGCVNYYSNNYPNTISQLNIGPKQSWTMDYWMKYQTYQSSGQGAYGLGQENSSSNNFLGLGFYRYELRLIGKGWGDKNGTAIKTYDGTLTGKWLHLAVQCSYDEVTGERTGYVFVDGEPIYEGTVTLSDSLNFNYMYLAMGPNVYFDELRISNALRYSGKFTPPTEPYAEPVYTGRSTIEADGKADTDLGNVTEYGKVSSVSWIMPDYSRAIATGLTGKPTSATTTSYTCPTDGWLHLHATRGDMDGNTLFLVRNGETHFYFPAYVKTFASLMIPVSKSDVLSLKTDATSGTWYVAKCLFIPCKGV